MEIAEAFGSRTARMDGATVVTFVHGLLPLDGAPLQPEDELVCLEIHGG